MPSHFSSAVLLATLLPVAASAATVHLVAGGGSAAEGPARDCKLTWPFAAIGDRAGNLVICEMTGNRVLRVTPDGTLSVVAGTGAKGAVDGPGRAASFDGPHMVAVHPVSGDIFVADTWNSSVRRIDAATGVVSRFAGSGAKGFSGDGGPAVQAAFNEVYCVGFDLGAKSLSVVDLGNHRMRSIDLASGLVRSVAAKADPALPVIAQPRAACIDAAGNLWVVSRGKGGPLQRIAADGTVTTVLSATASAGAKPLNGPKHLWADRDGNVLIVDTNNHLIRRWLVNEQKLVDVVGCGRKGKAGVGGDALAVELNEPHGVWQAPDGSLYVADSHNDRVLRVGP